MLRCGLGAVFGRLQFFRHTGKNAWSRLNSLGKFSTLRQQITSTKLPIPTLTSKPAKLIPFRRPSLCLRLLHSSRPIFNQLEKDPSSKLPILPPPSVGGWLMFSSVLVLGIIVVGGVTRLTESGLSITEWRPITGVIPPLSHEEWTIEFEKYKATPEFKLYDLFFPALFC